MKLFIDKGDNNMEQQSQKQFKRTSRHPSPETKQRISTSLTGRHQNDNTRELISKALKQYWNNMHNFPDDVARHEGTGKGYIETGDVV